MPANEVEQERRRLRETQELSADLCNAIRDSISTTRKGQSVPDEIDAALTALHEDCSEQREKLSSLLLWLNERVDDRRRYMAQLREAKAREVDAYFAYKASAISEDELQSLEANVDRLDRRMKELDQCITRSGEFLDQLELIKDETSTIWQRQKQLNQVEIPANTRIGRGGAELARTLMAAELMLQVLADLKTDVTQEAPQMRATLEQLRERVEHTLVSGKADNVLAEVDCSTGSIIRFRDNVVAKEVPLPSHAGVPLEFI